MVWDGDIEVLFIIRAPLCLPAILIGGAKYPEYAICKSYSSSSSVTSSCDSVIDYLSCFKA